MAITRINVSKRDNIYRRNGKLSQELLNFSLGHSRGSGITLLSKLLFCTLSEYLFTNNYKMNIQRVEWEKHIENKILHFPKRLSNINNILKSIGN